MATLVTLFFVAAVFFSIWFFLVAAAVDNVSKSVDNLRHEVHRLGHKLPADRDEP